jgi:hypothetical protein
MSLLEEIALDHKARIETLKRTLKCLARSWKLNPSEITRQDMEVLERMIVELGGDARTGAHRAITDSTKRSD